jgi:hypothetical protein
MLPALLGVPDPEENGGDMQIDSRLECELKYEPGEGYFVRKDKDPERVITAAEIVSAHTEYALLLLECYPSTWCSMLRLRGEYAN